MINNQSKSNSLNRNSANANNQPFEFKTRVEVSLPFNQKTVVRVRPDISLDELFNVVCKEACLDREHYELLITNNNPNANKSTLSSQDEFSSYNTKEIALVLKNGANVHMHPVKNQSNILFDTISWFKVDHINFVIHVSFYYFTSNGIFEYKKNISLEFKLILLRILSAFPQFN
jgi:hypothetical protein